MKEVSPQRSSLDAPRLTNRHDLECPADTTEALLRILRGRSHPVDAVRVSYRKCADDEHETVVWSFNIGITRAWLYVRMRHVSDFTVRGTVTFTFMTHSRQSTLGSRLV